MYKISHMGLKRLGIGNKDGLRWFGYAEHKMIKIQSNVVR